MKKEQQSNAGFSLIEVILSMAILAIVSIPLLDYFTESVKYNVRTGKQQQTTVLAQEVTETLKNQDQLLELLSTDEYASQYLLDNGYTLESNSIDSNTGIGTIVYVGEADAIGEDYDIRVTISTEAYQTLNTQELPQISNIDDTADVIAAESGQLQEALTYFLALNDSYCSSSDDGTLYTEAEIQSKMVRTFTVAIESDGSYYHVTVGCCYSCADLCGDGSLDIYECTALADATVQSLGRIYLLINPVQSEDMLEITVGTGVTDVPDWSVIYQGSDTPSGYQFWISGLDTGSKIYTNIGKNGNTGTIYNADTSLIVTDTLGLTEKAASVRIVGMQVDVYGKGEADSGEPYISVNTAKGE